MKICSKCKIEKELSCFHKKKGGKYGVAGSCKECRNEQKRIYFEKNKEKIYAANKERERKRRRIKGIDTREEADRKHSLRMKGKGNPNWKGGLTYIGDIVRGSAEYKKWRISCMERDGYTCQISGEKGVDLVVHHLSALKLLVSDTAEGDEIVHDIDNGITISAALHLEFHKQYGFHGFTVDDFLKFKKEKQGQMK